MQRRARFIAGGMAVLAVMALGRYGLIDSQRGAAGPSEVAAAPTVPATLVGAAVDSDAAAVRDWLRGQVRGQTVLYPGPGLDLLAELDEDPRDEGRVRLVPSGRSVPKVQGGEDERWSDGRLWPASRGLGDEQAPAFLDLHNIWAAEPDFEQRRGHGFGEGDETPTLEPVDSLKGDVARTLLYMSLRYDGEDGGTPLRLLVRPAAPDEAAIGGLCTLLDWNESDPVNSAERRRNERVERYQGNRNPFVDRPEFARVLWGRACPGRSPAS
jgi:hypothetical protein